MILLTTPRLILRESVQDDLPALYELDGDPETVPATSPMAPGHWKNAAVTSNGTLSSKRVVLVPPYSLGGVLAGARAPHRVVCPCGNHHKHHEAELGYALNCQYWGQGYMPARSWLSVTAQGRAGPRLP